MQYRNFVRGKSTMSIWFKEYSLEQLNSQNKDTMVEHCDISIIEMGEDFLAGEMLVSSKIKQPFGIVHGGANCVLAETLGSIAGNLTCDPTKSHAVGLSIHTNHIKAVRNGRIKGIAKATHMGRTTQVWQIDTYNDSKQLTSSTQLTLAIVRKV